MVSIEKVLSRADEFLLQKIFGQQTIKILNHLNEGFIYNSDLKELILKLHTPENIILNRELRNIFIDLLKIDEITLLAKILGVFKKNILIQELYSQVKRLNFRSGSSNEESLFVFFEIPLRQKKNEKNIISQSTVDSSYPLFLHQRNASRRISDFLYTPPHRALLHMPTGSGKTRTAMNIVSDHFRLQEPSVIIWLAATEELCEQAVEEFEKSWSFLGNRRMEIFRFWGERDLDIDSISEGFIVAGLPKMVRKSNESKGHEFIAGLARKVSFIIMDEAHQAVANMYEYVLNGLLYSGEPKKLLGLSATPGRTWNNKEADQQLANFFSRRKVKLIVDGYGSPVDYLTDQGYLAKVNYSSLFYEMKTLTKEDLDKIQKSQEVPMNLLNKLAEDDQRNLLIVNEARRLTKNHKRIILFAPSVDSSNMIAFILQSLGIKAYSLIGDTNSNLRKDIISDFKNEDKDAKIICNYGVLTTGFDAPKISAAIIGRPTFSLVLYSQMIGRAIRGIRAGGNKEAEIVTIIDQSLPGFRSVAEAFENWEDVW